MADNKKSFISYCDWGSTFDELSDEEAGKLVKHLFDYVRDKNPTPKDKLTKMLFIPIEQALKRDLVKYDKYIDKQKVNGKKGGRPKKNIKTQETQPFLEKPKKADNVNVNVNDNVSVNENVNDSSLIKNEKPVFHAHVYKCYDLSIIHFEEHLRPKNDKQKNQWLEVIEKLNRIDKIQFSKIVEIVEKTRNNDFWAKNFLSMLKLRKKDGNQTPYITVFNEQIKSNEQTGSNNNGKSTVGNTGVSSEYLKKLHNTLQSD